MSDDVPDLYDVARFVPERFRRLVSGHESEGGVEGSAWLRSLPRLVAECATQWSLRATGPLLHGMCAIVVPVDHAGAPAMLKVTWPHPEAEQEHLALRAWDGAGAVRLLAADPSRWALMLEPLDPYRDLSVVDVEESCWVIGTLLRHLDRPAIPQLVRLSDEAPRWAQRVLAAPSGVLPRRIADRAAALLVGLGSAEGADARLVHTDLHDANVLAGRHGPGEAGRHGPGEAGRHGPGGAPGWLAIDPKPLAAVPEFAVAPVVWNRWSEALAAPSLRDHLRWRVETVCEAAGLDERLAMDWTFARGALNAVWEAARTDADRDQVSANIAICKAMQE